MVTLKVKKNIPVSAGLGGEIILPSIKIGRGANAVRLEASASGKLETKSTVGVVEQSSKPAVEQIEQLDNVDLTIAPEVLEIQVADPTAGHGTAWIWTWITVETSIRRRCSRWIRWNTSRTSSGSAPRTLHAT